MLNKISAIVILAFLLVLGSTKLSVAQKDKVEGYWLNEEKEAKVEIYLAKSGKYNGRIVWLKEPNRNGQPKLDEQNPKANLKSQPIMGLIILKGFKKDGENNYNDGTIYDPKNGKTYSCKITFEKDNTLSIRGYVGISMLGRTTKWTRTTQ